MKSNFNMYEYYRDERKDLFIMPLLYAGEKIQVKAKSVRRAYAPYKAREILGKNLELRCLLWLWRKRK